MIIFDTTLLSHVFRRSERRVERAAVVDRFVEPMSKGARVGVPGIVMQELLSGVRTQRARRDLERALLGLHLLLADAAAHASAARIFTACREHGIAAGHVDCLVAAQTIQVDGALFTLDEDFRRIAKHSTLRLLE